MHEIFLTVQGNLASDVSYRVTPSGTPVAQFRVASSASRMDGQGQWQETGKAYFDVTCWRRAAENAHASLARGLPVVIHGRLRQRQVTRAVTGTPEATYQHTYNDLEAVGLGLDLTRCRAHYERSPVGPQTAVLPTAATVLEAGSPTPADMPAAGDGPPDGLLGQ